MENLVKQAAEAGRCTIGTFFHSGSVPVMSCLGYAGLDDVIIDTEHGPFETESASELIAAAKAAGTTPFARVRDSSRAAILKMLDAGAMGIIIPNVQSADEARQIVRHGKYLPLGERGISPSAGTRFWTGSDATQGLNHYFDVSNSTTLLIPQCETRGCLDEIDEVCGIDGIDGIFVGPFDLSAALGRPGQFDDPMVVDAIASVLEACRRHEKLSFIYVGDVPTAKLRIEQGFDSVAHTMDAALLMDAERNLLDDLR